MNPHALEVLEYHLVLERVAARAQSSLGRKRVLELVPTHHRSLAKAELVRVEEVAAFLRENPDWTPPEIPDARAGLEHLGLEGSVLESREVFTLGRLLTAGRELCEELSDTESELASLDLVREGLHGDRSQEKAIRAEVDREGSVLDSASRDLGRIRGKLRQAQGKVVRALEKLIKTLPDRIVVPDASVTIREGRYVIPVRTEGKGEVGGVVLDESATGATVFMEPPVALQLMGEIRALERDEAREIHRILRERTEALRPILPLLEGSQEALVVFDSLYARARAAQAWDGCAPDLLPAGAQEFEIVFGRHPLLLAGGKEAVVPFDLSLEPGERVLVVSGPNTGGKSVFLKALGLITTLAQSGVIPPVGPGTRLPVFSNVFADIGDEQSITESLSTFSAHLANLREIVSEADSESLVLIDEMGTGTDPQEGAALSRAILEELAGRGAFSIVTSHLGALKRLDGPGSGVVNASLQFDPDRLEPTYQLLKGRPGRSYGLAIARRLGLPSEILDRAEGHLPREEARMEDLLAALERKEKEASILVDSLSKERARARRLSDELRGREEDLESREKTAETRAKEEARRLLLEARQEVEAAIQEVRAVGEEALKDGDVLEETSRNARRRVEEAARRHRAKDREPRRGEPLEPLTLGDRVSLASGGAEGTVVEIREGRAVVEAAGVRLQVPLEELVFQGPPMENPPGTASASRQIATSWQGPEPVPESEIDLRGLRVMEVDLEIDRAVDQAVLGGLGEV